MKKLFKIFSLMIAVMVVSVLTGCAGTNVLKPAKFNSDKDMFAFATVSTANIFGSTKATLANENVNNGLVRLAAEEKANDELDMDKINSYLQMMENLLVDDGPIIVENGKSDKEGYESKLVFTVTDLSGKKTTYVIYYNQILEGEEKAEVTPDKPIEPEQPAEGENSEQPVEDEKTDKKEMKTMSKDEKDDDDDDDEEEDDQEIEYSLEGIAIIDGIEYKIIGEKELEHNEYELNIKICLDDKNYVLLEEEVEDDEHEYSYTVIKNGKKALDFEFELENNKNNEIEIEFTTIENGVKEVYEFEKEEKAGKTIIVIKHNKNGHVYKIYAEGTVNPETGEIEYTYRVKESNKKYHYEKGEEHAEPEEDDEDDK